MPAPTIVLMRLKAARPTDDFGSASTSCTPLMLPPGVLRILDLGGPGAKKGDLVMGGPVEEDNDLGAIFCFCLNSLISSKRYEFSSRAKRPNHSLFWYLYKT